MMQDGIVAIARSGSFADGLVAPPGNTTPLSILLVTASMDPSGLGEHMITLAAAFPPGVRATLLFGSTCYGLHYARHARTAGLAAFTLPLASLRQGTALFRAALARLRPDIVHVHAGIPEEGHGLAAAARSWGAGAVIRTEHNPYTLRTLHVHTHRTMELEQVYAEGLRNVDRVICVSLAARKTFKMARTTVPFSVVHNGIVPRSPATPGAVVRAGLGVGAAPLILTVARFVRQKHHITLVNALPLILAALPDAVLAWVGQGELEAGLRARARKLGVLDHILFLGSRNDVPDLMAAADVLCLPSKYEAHPLVILEALFAGLPVVASRTLGITEAVQNGVTGLLFPYDDAEALARKVARVLLDPALRERLRSAGLDSAQRDFTAARMAQETVAVYREALAERASSCCSKSSSGAGRPK